MIIVWENLKYISTQTIPNISVWFELIPKINRYLKIHKKPENTQTPENTRNTRESMRYPEILNQIVQNFYLTRARPTNNPNFYSNTQPDIEKKRFFCLTPTYDFLLISSSATREGFSISRVLSWTTSTAGAPRRALLVQTECYAGGPT